jgi:hypothetical protein
VDQHQPVGAGERPPALELPNPCPLDRRDGTANRQLDLDLVTVILEVRWVEHLLPHHVLHHVDPSAGVLR